MKSVVFKLRQLQYAALTLAAMTAATSVQAAGTLSGTPVDNIASVDFEVGGIPQEVIRSSPTGNSVPGATGGAFTSFVVDNLVDLSVSEVIGSHTLTTPGATAAVTTFDVTNDGNTPQGYALLATNLSASDPDVFLLSDTGADMVSFTVYVDDGDLAYGAGDTAGNIDTLAPDTTVRVFVVAEAPLGVTGADVANIRLTATTADAGTSGATLTSETTGGDTAGVDVVFADGPVGATYDGLEAADSGYTFSVADLLISKTSLLLSDPFNLTTDPHAIPGAIVEYTISLINNGTEDADDVIVTDAIPAEVIALAGQYDGGAADIEIQIEGAATSTFCTLAADADGCTLSGTGPGGEGGSLSINADTVSGWTIASADAADEVTILFQVEIL